VQEFFPAVVYLLCFATSSACAVLLARSYFRTKARLLLWSALCFLFLALNNLFVIMDLLLIPHFSLQIPRLALSLCAAAVLLFGFIWDLEE
jgi:hypothetical protein